MAFRRLFWAHNISLMLAIFFLFQGCSKIQRQVLVINPAPKVKMRLVYISPLKIFVSRYEISNREFRCFRASHSSGSYENISLDGDNQPVVNVSWNDARAFCEWLTANHGTTAAGKYVFRLPTEKEWEAFATCGTGSEFPWGAWPPPKRLNYYGRENSGPNQKLETSDGYRVSCPVRKSGENEWGLSGTGGNVWEWCADTDGSDHVLKGASWVDCDPLFLRTTRRSTYAADYKYINLGFRIVAEPAGQVVKASPEEKSPDKE